MKQQFLRAPADAIPSSRRNFIGASLGVAAVVSGSRLGGDTTTTGPMPREYEEILARTQHLPHLGHPRSWWVVRQGFLPIAPERVLVLEPTDSLQNANRGDRWTVRHRKARERLQKRLPKWDSSKGEEKQALIVRVAYELARYYDVLECWEEWAYRMAAHESLGSTGIGRNAAIPHQFQTVGRVNTVNSHVDWWMILLPGGTDCWEALDDKPVHAMLTHVYARPSSEQPGVDIPVLSLLSKGMQKADEDRPNIWRELPRMDRLSAARLMNWYIVQAAKEEPVWQYA